jgi:hypothetical protein
LTKLEDYILKNVNNVLAFENLKSVISRNNKFHNFLDYYVQKNFDLENEIGIKLMANLQERLSEMKNEFFEIKNEKILYKNKLQKEVNEMSKTLSLKQIKDKTKLEYECSAKTHELEKVTNELNYLELNCKKKETLFNKYIMLLKSRCRKTKEESYYDMNPALVIEADFEDKFKEQLLGLIEEHNEFTTEEKTKNKNLIEIYFKELSNREKLLQNSLSIKNRTLEDLEILSSEINSLEQTFAICEREVMTKKGAISDLVIKEKVLHEKIEIRNMNLSSNLEKLGELEFENYIKNNENVLKNMKKIYGNKVLDKVFREQKKKFLENVILDHSCKKNKINEHVSLINILDSSLSCLVSKVPSLEEEVKNVRIVIIY